MADAWARLDREMAMAFDFKDPSVWVSTPDDLQPPMDRDERADVVVVGGGLTGLSAALSLRDRGVDVLLLEMDYCGKGASGRNAGHLTTTIGRDVPSLIATFGRDKAIRLGGFAERAVACTESMFERYGIDCDYQPVGNIIAGVHPSHRDRLVKMARAADEIGIANAFLDEAEMRRRRLPEAFRFGVLEKAGGHLHPGKYVMGLRKAALKAGVRIREGVRVDRIDPSGPGVRVKAVRMTATGDKVLLATNAYTPTTLGRMRSTIAPMRDTLFWTRPLTDAQLDALGWDGREGVYTSHAVLESYRLTPDRRILGGSKFVQYGYGSSLPPGDDQALFARFARVLAERFPQVPGLEIESFWGGWIALTLDALPMSFAEHNGKVLYGMGYNGHGLAHATYNGTLLTDTIMGQPNEDFELLQRRAIPLPPEPLRWLVVRGLIGNAERIDRAIDADLARRGR